MTEDLEILQGAISAVVYQNYENGYAVLRLNVGGGQNVTVVGTAPPGWCSPSAKTTSIPAGLTFAFTS